MLEQEFREKYGLPDYDVQQLTLERKTAMYFLKLVQSAPNPKLAANLVINKLNPWAAENNCPVDACPVSAAHWGEMLGLIDGNQISSSTAYQRLFPAMLEAPETAPAELAARLNLLQNADSDFLETLADDVLARFPDKVQEFKKGKKGLLGMFMGELMKVSKGKADPKAATRVLEEKLKRL